MPSESYDIRPQVILTGLQASTILEAHGKMISHLVEKKRLPLDQKDEVLEALDRREAKISTAIGHGVALPHASITGLPSVLTLFAQTASEIDVPTPDGRPISTFFMVLVPSENYAAHLRTVAKVARFFGKPGVKERLPSCRTPEDVERLFNEHLEQD